MAESSAVRKRPEEWPDGLSTYWIDEATVVERLQDRPRAIALVGHILRRHHLPRPRPHGLESLPGHHQGLLQRRRVAHICRVQLRCTHHALAAIRVPASLRPAVLPIDIRAASRAIEDPIASNSGGTGDGTAFLWLGLKYRRDRYEFQQHGGCLEISSINLEVIWEMPM